MAIETKDIDKGFKAFLKELKILDNNPYVKVGFPKEKEQKHENSGASLALIASANEFGTSDGRIPERSFMRSTADENRKDIYSLIDSGLNDIMKQKTTVKKLLSKIGLMVTGLTQKKIVDITSPKNSEATIKKKGSSNPLIDTGYMRQSVNFEVKLNGSE